MIRARGSASAVPHPRLPVALLRLHPFFCTVHTPEGKHSCFFFFFERQHRIFFFFELTLLLQGIWSKVTLVLNKDGLHIFEGYSPVRRKKIALFIDLSPHIPLLVCSHWYDRCIFHLTRSQTPVRSWSYSSVFGYAALPHYFTFLTGPLYAPQRGTSRTCMHARDELSPSVRLTDRPPEVLETEEADQILSIYQIYRKKILKKSVYQ